MKIERCPDRSFSQNPTGLGWAGKRPKIKEFAFYSLPSLPPPHPEKLKNIIHVGGPYGLVPPASPSKKLESSALLANSVGFAGGGVCLDHQTVTGAARGHPTHWETFRDTTNTWLS